jgi:hypothetical protein
VVELRRCSVLEGIESLAGSSDLRVQVAAGTGLCVGDPVVCLFAMLGAGSASGAQGGTDRPFKCTGTGTFVFDVTAGTVTANTILRCTHLGLTTSVTVGPFDPTGAPTSYSAPLRAANGDMLYQTVTTTADNLTPTGFTYTNAVTIDGGTGRFADASGTASSTGTAVVASPSNPLVYNQTVTTVGTISY